MSGNRYEFGPQINEDRHRSVLGKQGEEKTIAVQYGRVTESRCVPLICKIRTPKYRKREGEALQSIEGEWGKLASGIQNAKEKIIPKKITRINENGLKLKVTD